MDSTPSPNQKDEEQELNRLAPFRKERLGILRLKYSDVRVLSHTAESIVKEVVSEHAKELDEFIVAVEAILERIRKDHGVVTNQELQRIVLRLPIIMYRLVDGVDRAAIESDIAKAASKLVYAEQYGKTTGTIPERQATAELRTADENAIVDLAKHVHARLKTRMEVADSLFDAVRKVMTSRDAEQMLGRKDKAQT